MERLTRRINDGTADCAYCTHEYLMTHGGKIIASCSQHCSVWKAQTERLAQYEETGLSPEQINEMAADVIAGIEKYGGPDAAIISASRTLQAYLDTGLSPERVQELATAERGGRLIELPNITLEEWEALAAMKDGD